MRFRSTLRFRMTVIYSILLTVFGLIVVGGVFVFMKFVPDYKSFNSLEDNSNEQLTTYTDAAYDDNSLYSLENGAVAYIDEEGNPRVYVGDDLANLQEGQDNSFSAEKFITIMDPGPILRIFSIDINNSRDMLNTLLLVSFITMLVMVVAGIFVSWLLAKRILAPLQAIVRAANLAAAGSLNHRIELLGPQDEIHDLSDTFNNMLGKLEKSFLAQQRFNANASHELRTPLSTTKVLIDVALSDPHIGQVELLETLSKVKDTNEKNIVLIETLLDLSVTNVVSASFVEIDLFKLVSQTVEDLRADLLEKSVGVEFTSLVENSVVLGDTVLLQRLFFNVLHNAVRYNMLGGFVKVDFFVEPGGVLVRIVNSGDVVVEENVGLLVEPFFRGAGRISGGFRNKSYGLGLALVANIVELHGGSLNIVANPGGGLVVEVFLLQGGGS